MLTGPARRSPRVPGPGAPPSPRVKRLLSKAGERMSDRMMYGLLSLFNYVHTGWWMRRSGFPIDEVVDSRLQVFDRIVETIGNVSVLYMEFGVAGGYSMRHWSAALRNEASLLHGFDSFEGLPSSWGVGWPASAFAQHDTVPKFDDERITLFPGWFSDTLPRYEWPTGWERLVVNFDADLYASTALVLDHLEPRIDIGTILYFDEFHHFADEQRAFTHFLERTGWSFEVLAASQDLAHVAFVRVT